MSDIDNTNIKNNLIDIGSLTKEKLTQYIEKIGEKRFVAKQLWDWIHNKRVYDIDNMSNISKSLRHKLGEYCFIPKLTIIEKQQSKDGTIKLLFETYDKEYVESVLMFYSYGTTICISSQIGCRMGCSFCASTLNGIRRSLNAYELLSQIYEASKLSEVNKISNVVVMGMGEPLDNLHELSSFIKIVTDEEGFNLSNRSITVSTCGLVPEIRKLADEQFSITLALSLHAPNDEKRKKIMPIANKYKIEELIDALNYYYNKTGRRITLEYCMIKDSNISICDAEELANIAKRTGSHINLIPVNPVKETGKEAPLDKDVKRFYNKLKDLKTNVTIRRELGQDIDGACGQLRNNRTKKEMCNADIFSD